jgi:hypothetical protein
VRRVTCDVLCVWQPQTVCTTLPPPPGYTCAGCCRAQAIRERGAPPPCQADRAPDARAAPALPAPRRRTCCALGAPSSAAAALSSPSATLAIVAASAAVSPASRSAALRASSCRGRARARAWVRGCV